MTKEERDALKKRYKRKAKKADRESQRWERMLQHTNGGLASPAQMDEQRKRKEAKK